MILANVLIRLLRLYYDFLFIYSKIAFCWPKNLLYIQFILYNTLLLIINKISNKIAYKFLFEKLLDLFSAFSLAHMYIA